MKFTLSWLKRFIDTKASLEEITHTLTMIGLEVEEVTDKAAQLQEFEVAEIIGAEKHPDADKLQVCKVQTKQEVLQIVCGAANARAGIKVALAPVGTLIPCGDFKIKKSKIRGVESCGMMCSYEELGLTGDSSGIIELAADAVIGDKVASYLGADDPVIEINITPNRADALGVYGIARDLAAAGLGILKKIPETKSSGSISADIKLNVQDAKACPLFAVKQLRGLENKKSPDWLVSDLENIGVGSISPIVDVTNYISYSFGQPMHAYDASKLSGDSLFVGLLEEKAELLALDEKTYSLQKGDLVISDKAGVQCLAGIIGAQNSACDENTNSIILEAANFSAENIMKTGRRLMLDTDSRYRFERNVDLEFTSTALEIAADMILEICGGDASEPLIQGAQKLEIRQIDFSSKDLLSKANLELSAEEISAILEKLGFECNISGKNIQINIPSWRYDVAIKEDIVEEIVRIYGYDNIPQEPLPGREIKRIISKEQQRINDIKRLFACANYNEVVTWSFMDSGKAKLFTEVKDELHLQNPISSDLDYMRSSILPNLLKVANNNINRSFHDLSLFEVGPVFLNTDAEVINNVAGIRCGNNAVKNSHNSQRQYDLFDIKADIAEMLALAGLDIDKCQLRSDAPDYYHPTRSCRIALGKNTLGYFGQVHPLILKEYGIDQDILAFEININNLPYSKPKLGKKPEYTPSDYQMIVRDYAFIVDDSVAVGEMLNLIKNTDKKLIKDVNIFDIYSGDKMQQGKKSVALSVNIQDNNKTLEEQDIEQINKKIIDGISSKFSGILRDGGGVGG